MLGKSQISPWSDNFYSDFQTQLKQTLIERIPVKTELKPLQTSKRFLSDSQIPINHLKKLKPPSTDIKKHKSLLLHKGIEPLVSNPQTKSMKHERRSSSYIPAEQKQKQEHQISEKGRKFLNMRVSSRQKSSDIATVFFDDENSRILQNKLHLFPLHKKQQIRWQNRRNLEQQINEREQIFKKVDEISRKRKKQFKLPRISVAYSLQRIIQ